jgi:MFS family permease
MTSGLSAAATAALLLAVFAVSVAYGVALPVLPFLLERVLGTGATAIAWHTGLLTGAYTLALFFFAPAWGRLSDRWERRPVILVGLIGFGASLALFAFVENLVPLYLGRFLSGAFAAGVVPVALALIGDRAPSEDWRARRFAWINIVGVGGFLVGPTLGGAIAWLANRGLLVSTAVPLSALPFLASAVAAFIAAAAVHVCIPARSGRDKPATGGGSADPKLAPVIRRLLLIAAVVAAAVGAFEVGLAIRAKELLGMSAAQIGLMFTECSLVMVAAQAIVFSPLVPAEMTRWLVIPALLVLGFALVAVPWATDTLSIFVVVGAVAASAGILSPIVMFWASFMAGELQGAELGRQTAAASLGQAVGSALGGLLFGLGDLPDLAFLVAAAATFGSVLIGYRLPALLSSQGAKPARAAIASRVVATTPLETARRRSP